MMKLSRLRKIGEACGSCQSKLFDASALVFKRYLSPAKQSNRGRIMELLRFAGNGADEINSEVLHLSGVVGGDYTLCGLSLDGYPLTVGSVETVTAPAVTCCRD